MIYPYSKASRRVEWSEMHAILLLHLYQCTTQCHSEHTSHTPFHSSSRHGTADYQTVVAPHCTKKEVHCSTEDTARGRVALEHRGFL
mmetsp:Transcript_6445/g.17549  ORF Transcript_6445/g.17549 Transcript_6445/m.17549 type:complete len:87 (-) Transcript_6445:610-870(-)